MRTLVTLVSKHRTSNIPAQKEQAVSALHSDPEGVAPAGLSSSCRSQHAHRWEQTSFSAVTQPFLVLTPWREGFPSYRGPWAMWSATPSRPPSTRQAVTCEMGLCYASLVWQNTFDFYDFVSIYPCLVYYLHFTFCC